MTVDSSICSGAFGETYLPAGAIILSGRNEIPDNDKHWAFSALAFEVPNTYAVVNVYLWTEGSASSGQSREAAGAQQVRLRFGLHTASCGDPIVDPFSLQKPCINSPCLPKHSRAKATLLSKRRSRGTQDLARPRGCGGNREVLSWG